MNPRLSILILAGGSGERFWPLSRKTAPKQLLRLFSGKTLLEETVARLEGLVPPSRILILTNHDQEKAVRELIATLPAENIVAEPDKRDTAAAVALGAGLIARQDPNAIMVVLPADHLIRDAAAFRADLETAAQAAAETGALVTIGIKPTWACPGFGYIEEGARWKDDLPVYEVIRFREKPNPELAETFLRQGNFRWNAGMFVWTIPSILSEFSRNAPHLADFVTAMKSAADLPAFLAASFPSLPKISIDYAVMEKAHRVLVVEAGFDWDDVGSWIAVAAYLPSDAHENRTNTPLIASKSSGNIVFSKTKKQVALLGVTDLIVVETDDALLVAGRAEAEHIKQLVKDVPPSLQ